ncbi:prepilin peptidase [Streptococcus pseudoporcinus]|uniref:Peptidase, A24 type IV prepilin peptidase family protein n=1 Tax=Streptococcus pseudoporcinus LQ 940-04 TaxID=875093 RepID=G5K9Q3_9STRE|nr:A24 family peptidase [Streptococcus pseudoporcinus]EFR44285.1 bacterial peptidase A24, N-terminal domain protein [Streptococcus pseudoporcinus SPIN 20026]EHI65216.1 peptidase, A24 type IV prepilin peptidase family protein [Streptococcus pseudoporcinus LQ 940-04]VEF93428.1 type IV leader peptidase family protein [Streptococcus pseudoporcinus]
MTILLYFFLGASLGSFAGLVLDRFPEKSILWPPSHCSNCQNQLGFKDLVPVLSFIVSACRCRFCKVPINPLYIILEVLYGLLFVFYALKGIFSLTDLTLISFSILLSLFDIKSRSYPMLFWLIAYTTTVMILGFNLLSCIFLTLALLAILFPQSIGSGDLFYLSLLALAYPLSTLLWIIQGASLLGMLHCHFTSQKSIPFIPFLTIALLMITLIT